jgi:hypothetical protein
MVLGNERRTGEKTNPIGVYAFKEGGQSVVTRDGDPANFSRKTST